MQNSQDSTHYESLVSNSLLAQMRAHFKASTLAWPTWWRSLSGAKKVLPLIPIHFYLITLHLLGGLTTDHLAICSILMILIYSGPIFKDIYDFIFPFFLTVVIYDSQRYYSDYLRGPIHVSEPYHFDQAFFGIFTQQHGILTPNEWWQLHTHPILDLITGFAYLVFFSVFILNSAYFLFVLGNRGTPYFSKTQITQYARMMPWGFFWLNMLGYSTYYWYAAAPPWYVAKYGLGPAQLGVAASTAGCARFDQILGTHFFSDMYGRSADVFGAIPSLHIAYPLLATVFAFHFKKARTFCTLFYLLMCFSAIYLNHHYVLDILWGSAYALAIGFIMISYTRRKLTHELS